jgi:hypothetical protein
MKHWIVIEVTTKRVDAKQLSRETFIIEPGNSGEGLRKLKGALARAAHAIKKDKSK